MSDSTINVPDYVTVVEPHGQRLTKVAQAAADLMVDAITANLPVPGYIDVGSGSHDLVVTMLGRDRATCEQLACWATHFGATITGQPLVASDGNACVLCQAIFIYRGVEVAVRCYLNTDN